MKQGDVRRRAVVFDFDGTLVDSMSLVFSAISHALEPFRPLTQAEIFAKLGGPPERFMPALLENDAHVPAAMLRLETFDRENQHLIQPFADTVTFLEAMRTRHPDVQLAIWTGRDRASGTWLMRTLRLESYFATVVFGDDLATHKPEPDGLREILRRLDVAPREALFVGDADADILGGVAAGVDSILIEHGRQIDPAVHRQAWRVVDSPGEAFEVVLGGCSGRASL